jgi:hypothetical protein
MELQEEKHPKKKSKLSVQMADMIAIHTRSILEPPVVFEKLLLENGHVDNQSIYIW